MFWSAQDPFAAGFGGGFAKPARSPYRPRPRYGYDREDELLRQQLYQQEIDRRAAAARAEQGRLREQRRRQAEAQAADRARRLRTRRLAILRYTGAARTIQRWWRASLAARREAAAVVVVAAMRRNCAVQQARRIAGSVARLRDLESTIVALPEANTEVLDRRAGAGRGISQFENTLEKLILSADDIPTHGSAFARAVRKRLVKTANARLQRFDQQVVALKAVKAEQAAEQEAARATVDDDAAVSGSDLDGSSAPISPITEIADWPEDEEERGGGVLDVEMEIEEQPATVAKASIEPESNRASPVGPRELRLGAPASFVNRCPASMDQDQEEEDVDQLSRLVDEADYDNAIVADLVGPHQLGSSCCELGGVSPESETSSELSFVEIDPKIMSSEGEDDGGESPTEMKLAMDPAMQYMLDSVSAPGHATNATAKLNVLVAKFAADLADIERGQNTCSEVRNTARDLQAAINGVLPTTKGSDSH